MHAQRRHASPRPRTGGFTLAELAIAIALVALLGVAAFEQVDPLLRLRARLDTRSRLQALRQAVIAAYRESAFRVDGEPGAWLDLAGGTLAPAGADPGGRCTASVGLLAPLARHVPVALGDLALDGTGAPVCVFVTPRQTLVSGGTSLYFHTVAIVSTGWNGVLDTDPACGRSGLSEDGVLTLCGDDEGVVVDGAGIVTEQFEHAEAQLRRIADAYQDYFQFRFQADATRDVAVDYFGSADAPAGRWDAAGPIGLSGCQGPVALNAGTVPTPADVLGLAPEEAIDAYGNAVGFDNCSPAVRSPLNPDPALAGPPYNALLTITLPGGSVYRASAIASY